MWRRTVGALIIGILLVSQTIGFFGVVAVGPRPEANPVLLQWDPPQCYGAEVRVAAGQPPIRKFQDTSETMTISPDKIFWDEKNDPYAALYWTTDEKHYEIRPVLRLEFVTDPYW